MMRAFSSEGRRSPPFRSSGSATSPNPKQENTASIEDEAEGFEEFLFLKVVRLERGEDRRIFD
jgi:hypothetical protein